MIKTLIIASGQVVTVSGEPVYSIYYYISKGIYDSFIYDKYIYGNLALPDYSNTILAGRSFIPILKITSANPVFEVKKVEDIIRIENSKPVVRIIKPAITHRINPDTVQVRIGLNKESDTVQRANLYPSLIQGIYGSFCYDKQVYGEMYEHTYTGDLIVGKAPTIKVEESISANRVHNTVNRIKISREVRPTGLHKNDNNISIRHNKASIKIR
jgi:hypothetical protein